MSSQHITLSSDVVTDGFVARTFTPEDAANYFILLLRTPPFQHFLRYYGIVCHQGAWYLTHNANMVQGTSPGVPIQSTPLLDFSSGATHGSVVPQRRWTPTDEVDFRRHVDGAALELPIFFVNQNGSIGFWLPDILRGRDRGLHNADKFAPLGGRATAQIRINWPGYRYWKRQINTRDETQGRNPISMARLMKVVGSSVNNFFRECMAHGYVATDPRWQIGSGRITQDHVKIIGIIHVSSGSWMPIIQLTQSVT